MATSIQNSQQVQLLKKQTGEPHTQKGEQSMKPNTKLSEAKNQKEDTVIRPGSVSSNRKLGGKIRQENRQVKEPAR